MVQIKQLKDDNGNQFYPRTSEKAIVDEQGVSLESKMSINGIFKGNGSGVMRAATKSDITALGIPSENTTYKLKIGNTTNGDSVNGIDLGTLESKPAVSGGSELSLVTTGEKEIWGNKEDVTTIEAPVDQTDPTNPITTLSCQLGKYYRIDVPIETLAITLPAMAANVTSVKTITIYLTGGTTPAVTITSADSKNVVLQDGYKIEAGKTYEVSCLYNGAAWVVGALTINTGE